MGKLIQAEANQAHTLATARVDKAVDLVNAQRAVNEAQTKLTEARDAFTKANNDFAAWLRENTEKV